MADNARVVSATVAMEACRYSGQSLEQLPDWVQQRVESVSSFNLTLRNSNPEELLSVANGQWIVCDAQGRMVAVSADQFARRYHLLSADVGAVHLTVHSSVFPPHVWNSDLIERASVAFHNSSAEEPDFVGWLALPEADRVAIRNAVRKALTAAISV